MESSKSVKEKKQEIYCLYNYKFYKQFGIEHFNQDE